MSGVVTAYHNLQVLPFKLVSIQELTLTKKMNEHATLRFTGIVPEEVRDQYVEMTEVYSAIEVNQLDHLGAPTPLFKGVILGVKVHSIRGIYYIEVEAASNTYFLDIQKKNRSYQDKELTYSSLFKLMSPYYPGLDIIDEATKGGKLGKFTLQYRETDWQFLKRLASRYNTGLVPAATFDKPKFHFGVPAGKAKGKLEDYHYTTRKKLADYLLYTYNGNQGMGEHDFLYYEVETDQVLAIGDHVTFHKQTLYVCEASTSMKDGLLKHRYTLSTKNGMNKSEIYNDEISGVSIIGKVLEVAKDHIKVHLNIDEKQDKGKAHWFLYATPYTAEGHSGWYCMPEINDFVQVNFPSHREEEGIASSSIRTNLASTATNKLDDPSTKYYRTAFGKEIKMSPTEIVITAQDNDIFIRLNEASGIEIFSKKEIKLISEADISVNASKKILLSAEEEISLKCKESKIMMDGSVQIFGKEVKAN
ncbi:hypothetical protein FJQ98_18620 [Lysinibacillus agricola]|uniref:Gp5/Type VI secretion system Vgr protein OB-fold domain-containing protein n=1 Tax=Lysinibacillus agricola TaxID=2590012 RepID=A0ABX7ANV6_9BACI|nr:MULTISPECIES: hypothetical protein [Lysinibacillus]KOS61841.1 hypothetical protein AN161_14885 [Lysinibacillus sp. FJAT-14222]QQP11216.1 hypothetical protein FJQ98_18620 [Lysinibacillus agricola]